MCALREGINNLYFGHRQAVGKLHNTVWFYKVPWSFPSHFPSLLNTLLMPVHILLSPIYNLQRHIFCNKHGTLINKTNKNTPLPCYKPNIKLQTCKMFKCKKKKKTLTIIKHSGTKRIRAKRIKPGGTEYNWM